MATKKRKLHRRKKASSGVKKSSRRRSSRRKKGFMGEMISHAGLKQSGKAFAGGLIGGGASGLIDSLLGENPNQLVRFGLNALVSVVAGAGMDMPNVAAGVGGAYGHSLVMKVQEKLLSEMESEDYADEDSLEEYPDALDEAGNPMFLAEDGEFYYMEEFQEGYQLSANNGRFALAESFQDRSMYPRYTDSRNF